MHRTIVRCTCIGPRQLTGLPPAKTMKPKAQDAIHRPSPPDHLECTHPRASSSMDRNILFDREPFAQLWRSTPIRRDDLSIRSPRATWHASAQRARPTLSYEGGPATSRSLRLFFSRLLLIRGSLGDLGPAIVRAICNRDNFLVIFSSLGLVAHLF